MCISNITPETQFSMLKPIIIQALHHICGFITTCGWCPLPLMYVPVSYSRYIVYIYVYTLYKLYII